jgi:hypothetical protein
MRIRHLTPKQLRWLEAVVEQNGGDKTPLVVTNFFDIVKTAKLGS